MQLRFIIPVSYTHLDVYKRQVLHSAQAMRRFCAANPEAQRHDFWCPTYDFAYAGAVNGYLSLIHI